MACEANVETKIVLPDLRYVGSDGGNVSDKCREFFCLGEQHVLMALCIDVCSVMMRWMNMLTARSATVAALYACSQCFLAYAGLSHRSSLRRLSPARTCPSFPSKSGAVWLNART